jgi:GABA permease
VIWRVLVFYIGSIFLVVTMLPWNATAVMKSPYVSALTVLHIPAADQIMNVIVLTAVLSCLNSGLYTSSRMLYALAKKGDAPRWFMRLNDRGVPIRAILLGTVVGYLSVIMSYVSPKQVFLFLLNSSGAVALFIYLLIAVSQLRMRARLEAERPERLQVRMWGYPALTYLTITALMAVIVSMALIPSTRSQLWTSLLSWLVVLVAYGLRERWGVGRSENVSPTERA